MILAAAYSMVGLVILCCWLNRLFWHLEHDRPGVSLLAIIVVVVLLVAFAAMWPIILVAAIATKLLESE